MPDTEVYVGLTADVIHHGHIRLLKAANRYGKVTVGLLTDQALQGHKVLPTLTFEQRSEILQELSSVDRVVEQPEWNYSHNIRRYKPKVFVHGDDWISGPDSELRPSCIAALGEYGGRLVEVAATPGVSTQRLRRAYGEMLKSPNSRISSLKRVLSASGFCRVVEAHNPLVAIMAEQCLVEEFGTSKGFDALWSSSLADSLVLGKPDNEVLSVGERLKFVDKILDVSTKPMLVDAETGGQLPHLIANCKTMVRMGISGVVVEDKTGLKQNSLLGSSSTQHQEVAETFANKIRAVRRAIFEQDFLVIARIESLILGNGMKDALSRAHLYSSSGADAILIHSRSSGPQEVLDFAHGFRMTDKKTPLACVPTTYSSAYERDLREAGFQIVIYANQPLRASALAIQRTLTSILRHERSKELEPELLAISDVLNLLNFEDD